MTEFVPGFRKKIGGIWFRIVQGRKACKPCAQRGVDPPCGHDLMLEWLTGIDDDWVAVPMPALFLAADFFCTNEERLYPQNLGFLGSKYFTTALLISMDEGWEKSTAYLQDQKRGGGAKGFPTLEDF